MATQGPKAAQTGPGRDAARAYYNYPPLGAAGVGVGVDANVNAWLEKIERRMDGTRHSCNNRLSDKKNGGCLS